MLRSISTIWYLTLQQVLFRSAINISMASWPSLAVSQIKPICSKIISRGIRLRALSSTARIVAVHEQSLGSFEATREKSSTSSCSLSRLEPEPFLRIRDSFSSSCFISSLLRFSWIALETFCGFFLSNFVSRLFYYGLRRPI